MNDASQVDAEVLAAGLPDAAAVERLAASLVDDPSAEGRAAIANALVGLAGREPHPRAKSALLDRAAALVIDSDWERSALLLRESMRLLPTPAVAARLVELADADASLARLGRMRSVIDAGAALAAQTGIASPGHSHRMAAQRHLALGDGAAALASLARAGAADGGHEDDEALREMAQSQSEARDEALTAARVAVAEADPADPADVAERLVELAELLVIGDSTPAVVTAVLADAADAGAAPERIAALWAEAARAAGQTDQLARALAAQLATDLPPHLRMRTADELANLPGVDRLAPAALIVALDALSEALPDDLALRARLLGTRALAGETDAEPALELLRAEAVRARDRTAEAAAALGLARIAAQRGDEERMDRMLRRVRTLEPDNGDALDHFEMRYRSAGEFERLYVLLGTRLAAAQGDRALQIAVEMAQLAEGTLSSPDRAAEAWHRVLALAPDHADALAALAQVERESGDALLLLELLRRRAAVLERRTLVGDAQARQALLTVLDEIIAISTSGGDLPDPDAHLQALRQLARICGQGPCDAERLLRLHGALSRSRPMEARDLLLKTLAAPHLLALPSSDQHALIAAALEGKADPELSSAATAALLAADEGVLRVGDRPEAPADDAADEAGGKGSSASDTAAADSIDSAQAERDAACAAAIARLEVALSALRGGSALTLLLRTLRRRIELAAPGDRALADLRGEAAALASATSDTVYGLSLRLDAVAANPGDHQARGGAVQQLTVVGRFAEAIALAASVLDADPADGAAALGESAAGAEDADAERVDVLRAGVAAALAAGGDDSSATQALARWTPRLASLEPGTALVARAAAQRAIADLDGVALAAAWAQMPGEEAGDRLALREHLISLAEGLAPAPASDHLWLAAQIATMDAAHDVAAALGLAALQHAEQSADAARIARCADLAARAARAAHDPAQALVALGTWVEVANDAERLAIYARIALAAAEVGDAERAWDAEIALLQADVDALAAAWSQAQLDVHAAESGSASAPAHGVVALSRQDAWTRLGAELASTSEQLGAPDLAVEALLDRAASLEEAEATAEARALLELAVQLALANDAGLAKAHAAWQARQGAASSAEDWARAEMLAEATKDWPAALRAIEAGAALAGDEAAADALLRAASLADGVAGDRAAAHKLWRRALALRPGAEAAWVGLRDAARASGDPEALIAVLDELLTAGVQDSGLWCSAFVERAELSDLDDPRLLDLAAPRLSALAAADFMDDTEEPIFAIVVARMEVDSLQRRAASMVAPVARKHGRLDELARALERSCDDGDPAARLQKLRDLATLQESSLGDFAASFGSLRRALQLAPSDESLWQRAGAVATRGGLDAEFDALLAAFAGIGAQEERHDSGAVAAEAAVADAGLRADLLLRLARRAEARGRPEAAAQAWQALSALRPDDGAPLDALEALWRDARDGDALVQVLEAQIARGVRQGAAADEQAARWLRLVAAHALQRNDRDASLDALERATLALPGEASLWLARLAALREHGSEAALRAGLRQHLDGLAATDVEALSASLRELAALEAGPAPEAAVALLLRALTIDPTDDEAAAAARQLAGAADDESLATLAELLALRGDLIEQDRVLDLRAARLSGKALGELRIAQATLRAIGLGRPMAALEALSDALAAAPELPDVAAKMEALAGAEQNGESVPPGTVAATLGMAADGVDDADVRRDLLQRAQRLFSAAGELEAALEVGGRLAREGGDAEAIRGHVEALLAAQRFAEAREAIALMSDREARRAQLLAMVEQTITRPDGVLDAVAALDQWLYEAQPEDDAYAMREALLEGLGEAGRSRLRAHREQALAAASDDADLAHGRRLTLAGHLSEDGENASAFALLAGAIEAEPLGPRRDETRSLALAIGEGAGLHLDAAALLAVTAQGAADAATRLLRAARLSATEAPAQAREWARASLACAGHDKAAATDAAALLLALHGGELPTDADADAIAAALEGHDSAAVAQLWQRRADAALAGDGGRDAAMRPLGEVARLAEDPSPALGQLAVLNPDDPSRWAALEASLGQARRDELVDRLLAAAEAASSEATRASLLVRAADIAEADGEFETAGAWLRLALEAGADAEVRAKLHRLLSESGQDDALAEALVDEAHADADPTQRIEGLRTAASLRRSHGQSAAARQVERELWQAGALGDAERLLLVGEALAAGEPDAEALAAQALELASEANRPALRAMLVGAALTRGDVAAAWDRLRGEDAGTEAARDALSPMAVLTLLEEAHQLGDEADAALAVCVRRLDAKAEPGAYASALLQRVGYRSDDAGRLELLDALVAHADGALADQGMALDWSARALQTAGGDRDRFDALLSRMADAEIGLRGTAAAALSTALAARGEPGDVQRATALVGLCGADAELCAAIARHVEVGDYALEALDDLCPALRHAGASELARALEQRAMAVAGDADRLRVARALAAAAADAVHPAAEAADGRGGADIVQAALEAWLAAAGEPGASEVLASLRVSAAASGSLFAFVDAAEAAMGRDDLGADTTRAIAAMAADAASQELGDPARAADIWGRVWDLLPQDREVRDAVLALRRLQGDPVRLAADLDRAVMAGGGSIGPLRLELADLLVEPIGRTRAAMTHLRAQLDEQPNDAEASGRLERLSTQAGLQRDAIESLARAYRRRGDDAALIGVLERRIGQRGDHGTVEDNRELAAALLRVGKLPQAATVAQRGIELGDGQSAAIGVEVATQLGTTAAIAEALVGLQRVSMESSTLVESLDRLLAALPQEAAARATREALLRALIAADPERADAFEALDALLQDEERWLDLCALRRARLAFTADDDARVSLLHEIAGVASAHGAMEEAIAAWRELGWLLDDDPGPWQAIADALEATDRTRERAEALQGVGLRSHGADKARALNEAARLLHRLDDRAAALEAYREAFAADPRSDEAFIQLERQPQEPGALVELLRRRAEAIPSGPTRVVVLRKLAGALQGLGDAQGAREALSRALVDAPDNDALAVELLEAAEAAGDWLAFRDAAEVRLRRNLPRQERLLLIRKAARLAVDADDDAGRWLKELEALAPGDSEAASLRGLVLAASDEPEQAAAGLEALVRSTQDPVRKVRLLGRLASLYSERLDQPAKAISALQRLLRLDRRRYDAHARLCELYHLRGSTEALVEAFRHWLEAMEEGDPTRIDVQTRLGALLLELGRDAEAEAPLMASVQAAPEDAHALGTLALLRTRQGDLAAAADLQLQAVEGLRRSGAKDELPAAMRRAAALLEHLGDHHEAQSLYSAALAAGPNDIEALLGHGRTSLAVDDVARAIADLEKVAGASSERASIQDRASALVLLGHCLIRQGKRAQARASFNRALELMPGLPAALEGLLGA